MNMPAVWKELKSEFDLFEEKLRAALCRATHYQQREVSSLRGRESDIKSWLDSRGAKAHEVFQWLTNKRKSEYGKRYAVRREEDRWRTLVVFREEATRTIKKVITVMMISV